jgi:hypothetical protein
MRTPHAETHGTSRDKQGPTSKLLRQTLTIKNRNVRQKDMPMIAGQQKVDCPQHQSKNQTENLS